MNNGGNGTHGNNNAGVNNNNTKQQIGKSGLDFNLTQPIQLSTSMPHHTTGNNKSASGFGVTQPGLQKILRSLGQKGQNPNVAAVSQHLNNNMTSHNNHHSAQASDIHKQTSALGAGSQSTKNMSGAGTQQRKSSSHKGRRVDINALNPQGISGSQSSTHHGKGSSSHHQQRSDQQQNNTSSIITNGSLANAAQNNNEQPSSTTAKGRSLLKNQLGDNLGKLPSRASRNPRQAIDGVPLLPPPSQSNTNPIMANHQGLSFNLNNQPAIGPTMGTESGGGNNITQSQQIVVPVARSQSGKRLPRGSDGGHKKQGGSGTSKFVSGGSGGGASGSMAIPVTTNQGNGEQQSRFAQRGVHKIAYHSQQTETGQPASALNANNQVLHQETNPNATQQAASNAKYFSQRLQNQLRPKPNEEKNGNGQRSSKDELLRAFINPGTSGSNSDQQKINGQQEEVKPSRQTNSIGAADNSDVNLKQRISSRSQGGKVQGSLNEIGGFQGSSLEKIQAKANKIKQGSQSSISDDNNSKNGGNQSSKSSLPQAANSFRAKLLRSHENQKDSESGLSNKIASKSKDEPQIIQNALNTLKKSLNKQQNAAAKPPKETMTTQQKKAAEEAKRKEKEKNMGPDDIVEYRGMKMTVSQREEYMEMEEEQIVKFRQNYYPAKFASKKNGVVVTYAANTHQGMVRNYNEDRVSIILNIIKPKFKQIDFWPRCSFFAIYDGHGGAQCADFLRDQLHQMVVRDPEFPMNPIKAMQRGFEQAEKNFLEFAHNESNVEAGSVQRSGSCAIVVLIIGEVCYVANVGDSRAFMSIDSGTKIVPLSIDHKPEHPDETERIEGNGGKVYQNQSYIPDPSPGNPSGTQTLIGPHRVFPGRLSVSRTIGDIEAKDERYGGNPNVVIATPEIRAFKIKDNYDFIAIGCDGVFEKMDNQEIMDQVWEASLQPENLKAPQTMHARCGAAVDASLNECVNQKTLDNITSVIIGFNNFEKLIDRARTTGARNDKIRDAGVVAEEFELDWELEMQQIEETDQNKVFTKLMKPLEPVEEEMMENSELETPLSEVIDVTRKKMTSKNRLADGPQSHNSSVSDRYASSSRRQSQLLESQDTTNLIDHDLLNQSHPISLTNSRKNLKRLDAQNEDQSQTNAAMEEEQAGIEQRKSAVNSAPNQQSQNGEQGSTKTSIVQKDYKIRQTSASPARVQRQNSDRNLRNKQSEPQQQPSMQTYFKQSDTRQAAAQYQTQQPVTSMINIPSASNTTSFGSNQIPQGKIAKTPNNPNQKQGGGATRNLIELKNSQERYQQKSLSTQLGKSGSQRPITPKRIILQKKVEGIQQSSQNSNPSKIIESHQYNSHGGTKPQQSGLITHNNNTSNNQQINSSAPQQSNIILSGKPSKSHNRRKEDVKLDEVVMGKFSKKMISNWVGPSTQPTGAVGNLPQNQSNSFQGGISNQNSSFQNSGPQKGVSKSYLTTKEHGIPAKSKVRTQRVTDNLQNMINQTHPSMPVSENLTKDQLGDVQNQFNSFGSHQQMIGKAPLIQEQVKQQSSGSNPPRMRKKSGVGKPSLGNKSMRMGNLATTASQRDPTITEPALNNAAFHQQLPLTTTKRTSASRNKPSYLQPGTSGSHNNQQHNSQGHGQNTGPNITLNFNQINLTTGSNRPQQHHVPTISQGQIPNTTGSFSSNNNGGAQGSSAPGAKQWYSNTINLAGIKQLSANVLKQAQQNQQMTSGVAQQQQSSSNKAAQGVVIKRMRDQ